MDGKQLSLFKKCTRCEEEKGRHHFYKQTDGPEGLRSHCKTCVKKAANDRFWKMSVKERRAKGKNSYWKHVEKRKKRNRDLYHERIKEGRCARCGDELAPDNKSRCFACIAHEKEMSDWRQRTGLGVYELYYEKYGLRRKV